MAHCSASTVRSIRSVLANRDIVVQKNYRYLENIRLNAYMYEIPEQPWLGGSCADRERMSGRLLTLLWLSE